MSNRKKNNQVEAKKRDMISASDFSADETIAGIDIMRLICSFLVCLIHLFCYSNSYIGDGQGKFVYLETCFFRIAVPFYFMSSGFLLFRKMSFRQIDYERVKQQCFKILRLLGTWSFLLFVGETWQLWYLGALVVAFLIVCLLLNSKIKLHYIVILAFLLYVIGLFGDSYDSFFRGLIKSEFLIKIIDCYKRFFLTTRNGLFFGVIFVFLGALYAHKRIVMKNTLAFGGFIVSMMGLYGEVYLLKKYANLSNYNMYICLIPATFFLFYFVIHLNLKNRKIYQRFRSVSVLIFFIHLLVLFFVHEYLEPFAVELGINSFAYRIMTVISISTIIAVIIEKLSRTKKLQWLQYLYS